MTMLRGSLLLFLPSIICQGAQMQGMGNFTGAFTLSGVEDTLELPSVVAEDGYSEGDILELPFTTGRFFVGSAGGGINFHWTTEDGKDVRAQVKFSHLKGDQTYHLALEWDLPQSLFKAWLNGVEQGDPLHGSAFDTLMPDRWIQPSRTAGDLIYAGIPVARIEFSDPTIESGPLDREGLAEHVAAMDLIPVSGEFRRTYTDGLPMAGMHLTEVYSTDFGESANWIHEQELLGADQERIRLPVPGQWVLEGDFVERKVVADGVRFVSLKPDNKKEGSWVFWHNLELPEDFLIEYSFTPERSDSGLNILFFNARGIDGESIFAPGQPARRGQFRSYIVGPINNYHVSPWATDEHRLRNSSNLRKNTGFKLVAIGDDRIGQRAFNKTHLIRVLKRGNSIKVEADGILVMEYADPGTVYGPVYRGGIAGLRFMAHTGSVTMHEYRVYRLEE